MLRSIQAGLIFLAWSSLVMTGVATCQPKKIYNIAGLQCECDPLTAATATSTATTTTTTTTWQMSCFRLNEPVDEYKATTAKMTIAKSTIATSALDERLNTTTIVAKESKQRRQRVVTTTLSDGSRITEHLVKSSHRLRRAIRFREVEHVGKTQRTPMFRIEFQPRSNSRRNYLEIVCDQGTAEIPGLLDKLKAADVVDVGEVKFRNCPLPKNITYGKILSDVPMKSFALYSPTLEGPTLPRKPFEGQAEFFEDFEISETERLTDALNDFEQDFFAPSSSLDVLTLRRNQLSSTESLQSAANLTELDLSSNPIKVLKSNAFQNLTKLTRLQLVDCQLETIDEQALWPLHNLQQLDLTRNNISQLASSVFSNAVRLTSLTMSANLFRAGLAENLLSPLASLENFTCSACELQAVDERVLLGTRSLTLLRLDRNQLGAIPVGIFNDSRKLRHLNLAHNELAELRVNLLPASLETIDLSYNRLKMIPEEFFQSANRIVEINLQNNLIGNVERDTLSYLSRLRTLNLANNLLSTLDPFSTGYLISLKTLDLSDNRFVSMPFVSVNVVKSLSEFTLRRNNIRFVDMYVFHSDALRIDLRDNPLETISVANLKADFDLAEADSKREYIVNSGLKCDCHLLEFFRYVRDRNSDTLGSFARSDLRCANSSEPLTTTPETEFRCSFNRTDGCPDHCRCVSVPAIGSVEVDCSGERLESLPELPSNTTLLNFDDNRLQETPDLGSYLHLNTVSLRNNRIETASTLFLRSPATLKNVSLANNRIGHIPPDAKVKFNFELAGNRLVCDCSTWHDLRKFFKGSGELFKDRNEVECSGQLLDASVEQLNNTPFVRLSDFVDDLSCDESVTHQKAVTTMTVGAVSLIALLLVGVVVAYYRNRRRIIVFMYNNYYRVYVFIWRDGEVDSDKPYDAFVSYSEKDADVVAELIDELERIDPETGDKAYKLCVHYRDWIAGNSVVYNIVNSVQHSRRTVLVLSESFINSEWLNVEFKAAFTQMLQDRSHKLILIVKGELPSKDTLDSEIQELLTKTYLKWGSAGFWDNLRFLLPHQPPPQKRKAIQKTKSMLSKHGHPMSNILTGNRPSSTTLSRTAQALENEKHRLKSIAKPNADVRHDGYAAAGRINEAYSSLSTEDISVHCDSLNKNDKLKVSSARLCSPVNSGLRPPPRKKPKATSDT